MGTICNLWQIQAVSYFIMRRNMVQYKDKIGGV